MLVWDHCKFRYNWGRSLPQQRFEFEKVNVTLLGGVQAVCLKRFFATLRKGGVIKHVATSLQASARGLL